MLCLSKISLRCCAGEIKGEDKTGAATDEEDMVGMARSDALKRRDEKKKGWKIGRLIRSGGEAYVVVVVCCGNSHEWKQKVDQVERTAHHHHRGMRRRAQLR